MRPSAKSRSASSRARRSIVPQASGGTVFLTSPACSCVATAVMPGARVVQLALDAQQLARERAQRGAALVGRGARVGGHAVRGDRDPAAGLARRHDRARLAAALEAQRRRRRRASASSVKGATLRPSSSGTRVQLDLRGGAAAREPLERGEPDEHAALHVGDAGPERALALEPQRPRRGGARRIDGVVVAEQQHAPPTRPCRRARRRAGRPARARARRRARPRAAHCASSVAQASSPAVMPRRRVDRAQLPQPLEVASGGRSSPRLTRAADLRRCVRRQAARSSGRAAAARGSAAARARPRRPASSRAASRRPCGSRW